MRQFNINTGSNKTFVAFHGTGGNEYSLLQFVGDFNREANYRAYIGDVGEGANRRFYAPLVNGQLDREDFDAQVDAFLKQWATEKIEGDVTFIGYSNGANFILGLLEREPAIANEVILLKPMKFDYTFAQGSDTSIVVSIGARDVLSVAGNSIQLVKQLAETFPNTAYKLFDHGHEITDEEIRGLRGMLK